MTAWVVGVWGAASTLLALLLRGGLSLKLFGIGVRDARGELASRLRCAWRSSLTCLSLVVPYGIGAWLAQDGHVPVGVVLTAATVVIHALAIGYAIAHPSRSLQDRASGTRLVPR